jgi:hypothetical protein
LSAFELVAEAELVEDVADVELDRSVSEGFGSA